MGQKFKKCIILGLLAVSSSDIFADDSVNYLDINITKLDYRRPLENEISAGELKFTSVNMARANIAFNLKNNNNAFDANLSLYKNVLGFKTPDMNFDFIMEEKSSILSFDKFLIESAQAYINPLFFSFNGEHLSMKNESMDLSLDNFSTYCSTDSDKVDMSTADGIESGCLTDLILDVKDSKKPFKLTTILLDENKADEINFSAEMKSLRIIDSSMIKATFQNSKLKVSKYDVETKDIDFTCFKDPELKVFDTDQIMSDCENSMEVQTPKIVIDNKSDVTRFFIDFDFLKVSEQRALFSAPVIQFAEKDSSVSIFGTTFDCRKDKTAIVYDLQDMITQCLLEGDIFIKRLVNKDEKTLWNKYPKILKEDFNPVSHIANDERDVKNISISLRDNKMKLTAIAYKRILGINTKFEVKLSGKVTQYREREELVLDVEEIGVPIGWFEIKWKKTLLSIMKKALVGENIEFLKNGKIVLKL